MKLNNEAKLQIQVARYLANNYPEVQFHSDFGSGAYLTKTQAAIQSKQNAGRRGWPDMFIAKPKIELKRADKNMIELPDTDGYGYDGVLSEEDFFYDYDFEAGLFIELKADGVRLKKKNGEWADDHIAEQAEILEELRQAGYCAEFAVGFEEAVKIITKYLGEPKPEKVEF